MNKTISVRSADLGYDVRAMKTITVGISPFVTEVKYETKTGKPRTVKGSIEKIVDTLIRSGYKVEVNASGGESTSKETCDSMTAALREFVNTIDSTGGVVLDDHGWYCPVGDPEWIDLGSAYTHACDALGRKPLVVKDE